MTTRGGASLVERAWHHLAGGPRHSLDIAREVLRLSGPPSVLTRAVAALLETDGRFQVDTRGIWSLGSDAYGPPLAELSFAVVDVEATGSSHPSGDRIIEIAVVPVEGGVVGDAWRTLINPGRPIPWAVQLLTGISDEMVRDAPWFDHVAVTLAERLEGRVFVAHNAGFDWRIVSSELGQALGIQAPARRLCTLQMARRLLPALRRRNLDALSRYYGIPIHERHRAYGDALATARVLVRLLEEARARGLTDLPGLERFLGHGGVRRKPRRSPTRREGTDSRRPGPPGEAARP